VLTAEINCSELTLHIHMNRSDRTYKLYEFIKTSSKHWISQIRWNSFFAICYTNTPSGPIWCKL